MLAFSWCSTSTVYKNADTSHKHNTHCTRLFICLFDFSRLRFSLLQTIWLWMLDVFVCSYIIQYARFIWLVAEWRVHEHNDDDVPNAKINNQHHQKCSKQSSIHQCTVHTQHYSNCMYSTRMSYVEYIVYVCRARIYLFIYLFVFTSNNLKPHPLLQYFLMWIFSSNLRENIVKILSVGHGSDSDSTQEKVSLAWSCVLPHVFCRCVKTCDRCENQPQQQQKMAISFWVNANLIMFLYANKPLKFLRKFCCFTYLVFTYV